MEMEDSMCKEVSISKSLIRRLALECFDSTITEDQIAQVINDYNNDLELAGGMLYMGDIADIIYDVLNCQ